MDLCFVCVCNTATTLESHLVSAHGWPSENCILVKKVAYFYWRFEYSTQCLAVLSSSACDSKDDYINGIKRFARSIQDPLVFPPGYSIVANLEETLAAAAYWKDKYTLVEEELIESLEHRQFFPGILAL